MCSEEWESTYLKLVRVVTNPKKFSKVLHAWHIDQNARILDLCCGSGGSLEVFLKAGYRRLYGLDISYNLLSRIRNGLPLVLADANACPIGSGVFDVVVIHKALHHFLDHRLLLGEIKRVLKPDGLFCFIEPRKTWFRKLYHLVLLSPFVEIFPSLLNVRKAALIEEGETYFRWLDNAQRFINILEKDHAFTMVSRTDDLLHHIVQCRKSLQQGRTPDSSTAMHDCKL